MKKRVLVTQITGYVGQHVAAGPLRQTYEVVGTLHSLAKAENAEAALSSLPGATEVIHVQADLCLMRVGPKLRNVATMSFTSPLLFY